MDGGERMSLKKNRERTGHSSLGLEAGLYSKQALWAPLHHSSSPPRVYSLQQRLMAAAAQHTLQCLEHWYL